MVTGCLWVVVGVGCCVVVAIGGVVGLWLWLVEERNDVTSCDISVMFKLTCEITCTISCDFLAVYSKNPSVLLSSGKTHLPTSTSENHLSLAGITGGQ